MEWEKCKYCGEGELVLGENINSGRCIECTFKGYRNWLLIPLISLLILTGALSYVLWGYPLQRDVWGVLDRAQITAESDDMLRFVKDARISLGEKNGLFSGKSQAKGNCALIFKEPSNSLDAQYLAIRNIEKRLERTNEFDKNSVEYQSAIDDIRGTIRELPYLDCWIWHFN